MIREYFLKLEGLEENTQIDLDSVVENLAFNDDGLVPVITQDADTQHVLMMAWMNKPALQKTLNTNRMTYWSRSRNSFWVKGETSGHTQELVSMVMQFYVWLNKRVPLAIPDESTAFI